MPDVFGLKAWAVRPLCAVGIVYHRMCADPGFRIILAAGPLRTQLRDHPRTSSPCQGGVHEHVADLLQDRRLADVVGAHDYGDRARPTEWVGIAAVADADPVNAKRELVSIAGECFGHADDRIRW